MPSGTRAPAVKWRRIYLFDGEGRPQGNDAAPVYIEWDGVWPDWHRYEGVTYWRDSKVPSNYRALEKNP